MKLLLQMLIAVAAAFGAGGGRLVIAQESAGGYTTRVGGQPFGTESYKITTNADGSRRAEADAAFGGTKLRVVTAVGAALLLVSPMPLVPGTLTPGLAAADALLDHVAR